MTNGFKTCSEYKITGKYVKHQTAQIVLKDMLLPSVQSSSEDLRPNSKLENFQFKKQNIFWRIDGNRSIRAEKTTQAAIYRM